MSWKDAKRAEALTKSERFYNPKEIQDAWVQVLTGPYGDVIIYSLHMEANKPTIRLENIDPNAAVFREGKRDLIDQILRQANTQLTQERKTDGR